MRCFLKLHLASSYVKLVLEGLFLRWDALIHENVVFLSHFFYLIRIKLLYELK